LSSHTKTLLLFLWRSVDVVYRLGNSPGRKKSDLAGGDPVSARDESSISRQASLASSFRGYSIAWTVRAHRHVRRHPVFSRTVQPPKLPTRSPHRPAVSTQFANRSAHRIRCSTPNIDTSNENPRMHELRAGSQKAYLKNGHSVMGRSPQSLWVEHPRYPKKL